MAEIVVEVVAAVVVAVEIAGNRPIKTCRALERGIWEQIPRFFFKFFRVSRGCWFTELFSKCRSESFLPFVSNGRTLRDTANKR